MASYACVITDTVYICHLPLSAKPSACIYNARVRESLKADALLERILITCKGKYTDGFLAKTETKQKEARCLTSSRSR